MNADLVEAARNMAQILKHESRRKLPNIQTEPSVENEKTEKSNFSPV